nr:hypothetical transcript [Hymenolepis microstoma]
MIKFLYPHFGEFFSQFSDVKIELSPSYLWEDIVPFIVEKFRLTPESGLEYVRSICEKNGHFFQINDEQYAKEVMRVFLKTHHLWDRQYSDLPVIVVVISSIQKHLLHMQSLCGDLGIFDNWMKQSFRLYCHCLDQLGHSGTVLPSQIFYSGGRSRDIDFYVERFERSLISSNVPLLFSLAIKATRFQIRQVILSKPLPRPSFSSQLDSLSILSPKVKKLVQIERFE